MIRKIKNVILPVIIGLLLSVVFIQLLQTLMISINHIDMSADGAFIFQALVDSDEFLPIYAIVFLAAIVFQFFVTLRIWNIYKQRRELRLKPWQLVLLFCLLFGIAVAFIFPDNIEKTQVFFLKILIGILLGLVYWTGNLTTLSLTVKKDSGGQKIV